MTIKVGDKLPNATLFRVGSDGIETFEADSFFAGRKVVVFGLPGAFTPTCTAQHMPGYVMRADEFAAKGVAVACLSVNDAWVMKAWAKDQGAAGKVEMLADGNAELRQLVDSRLVGTHDAALHDAELVEGSAHGVQRPFCFSAAFRRGNTRRALPSKMAWRSASEISSAST